MIRASLVLASPRAACQQTYMTEQLANLSAAASGQTPPPSGVRAVGLTKTHRSGGGHEVTVFSELTFSIAPGERVAIVGASGAGKSSLLHVLGGLDRPTAGTVWHGDQALSAMPDRALAAFRNRYVSFVWQMNSLLPEFSAAENVMMPLLIRGESRHRSAQKAAAALDQVGLSQRATHKPGELSGGEQQRVALARALVGEPRLLLADEPTGNLDYRSAEGVAKLIADLSKALGFTTVIVTHNQAFAETCDRVLQLEKGGFA